MTLLGKTVLLRVNKNLARPAVVVYIHEDDMLDTGCVDLYILPHQTGGGEVSPQVPLGYNVGQWQHPECIPHDDLGRPDYSQVDEERGQ